MSAAQRTRRERGFVAIEWVLAVAVLLLPVVLLVASLPGWAQRRHTATVAAREAATLVVREIPSVDVGRAELLAKIVAANHGLDPDSIDVTVGGGTGRGDVVSVTVRVQMPAIALPGLDGVTGWSHEVTQHRRVDDYRSR